MFWVRGYNALGGLVTDCFQTLHILDTGSTSRNPDEYYDEAADRAYGAQKLYLMDLSIDYLRLQTNYKIFPSYYYDSAYDMYRR